MENEMRASFVIAASAVLLLASAPAIGQTPQQNARESTGMAASQNQYGGLKRDRRISRMIFRNAHNRMRPHHLAPK
jgi:hypothetical protein